MDSRRRLDMDALRSGRAQERAGIILKYEQGPRKVPQFHLGEEDESGALVPDKLGFLCKQKPPRHGCLAVQWRKHQEGRRLQKWNKMLRNFTKYRSSEKFHRRIEKGIPAQVRGKVWAMMLSVDTRKAQNPGKFEEMKERARLCSDQVQQIDEEVARTFRSHIMFRERYGAKQRSLFEVLLAYSMYNPELGYSQGLSHVAALLLMWLSEEDAFWALVQLMGTASTRCMISTHQTPQNWSDSSTTWETSCIACCPPWRNTWRRRLCTLRTTPHNGTSSASWMGCRSPWHFGCGIFTSLRARRYSPAWCTPSSRSTESAC
nr:USP6 N-terminal-like protein isoform X3 [Oryctolagus cuniculus]